MSVHLACRRSADPGRQRAWPMRSRRLVAAAGGSMRSILRQSLRQDLVRDLGEAIAHGARRNEAGRSRDAAQMADDVRHAERRSKGTEAGSVVATVPHESKAAERGGWFLTELGDAKSQSPGSLVVAVEGGVQVNARLGVSS